MLLEDWNLPRGSVSLLSLSFWKGWSNSARRLVGQTHLLILRVAYKCDMYVDLSVNTVIICSPPPPQAHLAWS